MTRKVIRFALYFMIFLVIGKIALDITLGIYRKIFPPPPPPPTVSFGKLPLLPFPQSQGPENLTITIETPDGKLPEFPTQMKVYFMPKPSQTQLNLDQARKQASNLGFSPDGQQESEIIYRFPHKSVLSTLRSNIVSGAFSITYDLPADPGVLDRVPPAPEIAVSIVRGYLSSAKILPEDMTGPTKHEFLRAQN